MNEIDFHKTGEEFEYNGRKFRAVDTCELCGLKEECCNERIMSCSYDDRPDYRDVVYQEVNKRKEMGTLLLKVISLLLLTVFSIVIISLFLRGEYLVGLLLMLCVMFVVTDAWVNRSKS